MDDNTGVECVRLSFVVCARSYPIPSYTLFSISINAGAMVFLYSSKQISASRNCANFRLNPFGLDALPNEIASCGIPNNDSRASLNVDLPVALCPNKNRSGKLFVWLVMITRNNAAHANMIPTIPFSASEKASLTNFAQCSKVEALYRSCTNSLPLF